MESALGSATSLLGKVLSKLSEGVVAAYVDSLELGHNSVQIKAKLRYTKGLLQIAQGRDMSSVPELKEMLEEMLEELSRQADQAEDLLDEIHYFKIHDRLHGTSYATTEEAGPDLSSAVRHQSLHSRAALRHTVCSLLQCFSCSHVKDGANDSALVGATRRPQIGSLIIQETLYGRRDTFEKTVSRIISCTQTVSVLPIVGPGGIGKTTFAQHLYNDSRIENHFKVRVWVCVSTDFDVFKLTREILGCIPETEGKGSSSVPNEATNFDQIQLSIAHRLKSKRFLVVLDDIWRCGSEDQWKTLLAPFTKGEAKGSMVLVTTRFPKLAQVMKTVDPLELRGLESNDFLTFFEACILGDHKPEHYKYELADIAGKIANKLKGSPLAAKTVGRLLRRDLSPEHWNGVLQKHEWLKQQNNDEIMPSLKISYDYLPFDLKKCFSYLGLFPEDRWFMVF